jgi:hypothetical protein
LKEKKSMNTPFRRILDALKKPFVFVGLALLALVMVLGDLFLAGRRSEKRIQLKKEGKDEQAKIDKMAADGDADALAADILRRTGK